MILGSEGPRVRGFEGSGSAAVLRRFAPLVAAGLFEGRDMPSRCVCLFLLQEGFQMQGYPVRIHDSVAGTVSAAALNQRVFVHSSPEVTVPMGVFHCLSVTLRTAFPRCVGAAGVVAEAILFLTGGIDIEVRCLSMGQDDPFAMETLLADPILRSLR